MGVLEEEDGAVLPGQPAHQRHRHFEGELAALDQRLEPLTHIGSDVEQRAKRARSIQRIAHSRTHTGRPSAGLAEAPDQRWLASSGFASKV